ncbi:hypothetical protein [Corynebacterium callunae]|uniref:Uncharacterized protein n=1 Tax=Corynebacterium callunae DSM 20147 TaxID=1121353 RepID=M1UHZ3_9CORY|nr:hypothetical protein [Corynebacterium callunae]AGG68065.1 hypothetical protein H924_13380 [Corynebacterium callunae DSM 20147]
MPIGSATEKANQAATSSTQKSAKKALTDANTSTSTQSKKVAPLAGFEQRAATLRLYVKNKELLKDAKLAALEDDTSLSQLWEEWAIEWLKNR